MADFRRRGALAMRTRQPPLGRMIDEEIHPASGWTSNSEFHFLLIDVPGYGRDDIKLNVDEAARTIVVKGSRKKAENRREHFDKSFEVPEDGDIKSISMEFDGITLRVRVPKVPKQPDDEPNGTDEDSSSKEDKGEPKVPATSPSNSTKGDELKDTKRPGSVPKEDPVKPEDPESSHKHKETNGEAEHPDSSKHEHTNVISEEDRQPKIPPPSTGTSSGEDTKGSTAESSQPKNGKKKVPEKPKEFETNKKPNDQGPKKETSDQPKRSSKTSVMGKVVENKGILLASLISFTLGVLLSQKFHHPPHLQ